MGTKWNIFINKFLKIKRHNDAKYLQIVLHVSEKKEEASVGRHPLFRIVRDENDVDFHNS